MKFNAIHMSQIKNKFFARRNVTLPNLSRNLCGRDNDMTDFTPPFSPESYSDEDRTLLAPFFTNLDRSVYVPLMLPPELIGACVSDTHSTHAREHGRIRFCPPRTRKKDPE